MPDEKVKYPFEHLVAMEKEAYFIQTGHSVYTLQGEYFFDKISVDNINEGLMKGFRDVIKNGNKKEKEAAFKMLLTLNVFPLRFH
jgi:hypothetical protein